MRLASLLVAFCGACGGGGGDDDDATADAPNVPATIMISGTASSIGVGGSTPEAGVLVEAFANAADTTVITMAMTDAQGNYTLTVTTNGKPLDGFLKATRGSDFVDTYLYPPFALATDFAGASMNLVSSGTFDALYSFCGVSGGDPTKGLVAVLVTNDPTMASAQAVEGATISSSPAATKSCYNASNGLPSGSATATQPDGIGYLFDVTGNATVTAAKTGATFKSTKVNARAVSLIMMLVIP